MTIAITEKQKDILVKLRADLRLNGFAADIENQYENLAVYAGLSFEDRLLSCIEKQIQSDKERKCANLVKRAKFKDKLRLSDLTRTSEYGLSKAVLASLASLQWVTKCCNIIISGSCGVGKTGLANALGYNCCTNGISVRCYRTSDLLLEMSAKQGMEKIRFMKNLLRYQVLILDDFGIAPINSEETQDLFNLLDDRYKVAPVIVATQLKKEGLSIFLGNDTKTEAAADRLLHPSMNIELKGPSRRN